MNAFVSWKQNNIERREKSENRTDDYIEEEIEMFARVIEFW